MTTIALTVALDGARRRDIKLTAGDELTLTLTVYERDADLLPIAVTNVEFSSPYYPRLTLPIGDLFTAPDTYGGRRRYSISADIDGDRTSICYGVLEIYGGEGSYPSGSDYGWWPWNGQIWP